MRRLILWTAFVLLAAVELYGFVSTDILAQQIWSSVGIRRLSEFTAVYLLLAGITLGWQPRICGPLLAILMLVWTVLAVGWMPVLAVVLLLLASRQLGRLALAASGEPTPTDLMGELWLLSGLGIYSFLQGLLVHFPINSRSSAAMLVILPFLVRPRALIEIFLDLGKLLRGLATRSRPQQFALACLGFPLAAHWLVALQPEVSNDGLTMHLAASSTVAHAGYWSFDFHEALWALMPMGGDWTYTLAYLLGNEGAARLINLALLGVIASIIFRMARRWLTVQEAAIVTALFLSTPLVQLVTGSLFVENFWTAMILGSFASLWRFHETGRSAHLSIAGILLGVAASAKLGAFAFAAPLLALACVLGWRRSLESSGARILKLLPMFLLFGVLASPPYITAYLKTGNPIFPFRNDLFASSYHVPARLVRDLRFERPLTWRTLYDLTFHSGRFTEGQAGSAGFQYLLLAPFAFLATFGRGAKMEWLATISAAGGFLLIFSLQSNLRYCYPAMALASIGLAPAIARCRKDYKGLYRCVAGACVGIAILNVYFLAASGSLHRDFWLNPFSPDEARGYVERHAPGRPLIDELNRTAPGEPAMFVDTVQIAGLQGRALTTGWYHWPLVLELNTAISPQAVLKIVHRRGVRHFISPAPDAVMLPAFAPFLTLFTDLVRQSGSMQLRTLKSGFLDDDVQERTRESSASPPPTAPHAASVPLAAGDHDDDSRQILHSGLWARAAQFPQAFGESFMYSNVPGATVEFSFEGTALTYVYTRAVNRGKAGVRIDGGDWEVLDLFTPQFEWQARTTWKGLSPGIHEAQIRVLPERNPSSEGFYIDVDAILVR